MGVIAFTLDGEWMREFMRFPQRLYRDDDGWVPPLEAAVYAQLDPDADFLRQPGNAQRHFIARLRHRTLGRVTASINAALKDENGAPIGCLGGFEAVADPAVADDLIGAAMRWLRDRHAVRRILGPMNFDVWHGYRFMTRGFAEQRFLGEPYNPPYYPELFERSGFALRQRWHSYEAPAAAYQDYERRAREKQPLLRDLGYRFVAFDRTQLGKEFRKLHHLLHRCYGHFPAFTPISPQEFASIAQPLRHALLPGSAVFVHDEHDQPCGFAVALLDLAEALRAMRGRNSCLAWARFLQVRRRARRTFLHMVGLVPEHAQRKRGLGAVLMAQVAAELRAHGQAPQLAALVAQGSPSQKHLERIGASATREYALYEARA